MNASRDKDAWDLLMKTTLIMGCGRGLKCAIQGGVNLLTNFINFYVCKIGDADF